MARKMRVLIAAGGTGGHLFPAQQLSELLKSDCELFFAGYKLEQSPFFEKEKIPFQEISSAPLKKIVSFLFAATRGFYQSLKLIFRLRPDVVVGFGSYHSFPVLLAAAFLRKKIVLFEANCILGKVNRLFLPAAEKIALQFPIELKKGVFVPLLPWTRAGTFLDPQEARLGYGLDPNKFTVLVFGGSQGAAFLNEEFPKTAEILKKLDFQVLHLTGKGGSAKYGIPSFVKEFEVDMRKAYAAADVVVCRSGAGTCAELIRFQKPALLIPYPFAAEDHQRINGQFLSDKIGGTRMVLQKEATAERMASELEELLKQKQKHAEALKKAKQQETIDFGTIVRNIGKR